MDCVGAANPVPPRLLKGLIGVAALPLLVLASCEAQIRTAEYRAQSFCAGIPLGSDVRLALQRFEATTGKPDVRHPADGNAHVFLFPSSFNDRAYCQVTPDGPGHVVSKGTFTLYD